MSDDEHRNIGIGGDGKILPISSDEVDEIVKDATFNGEIVMVVSKKDEQLAVKVFGPPSWETLEILEHITKTYRQVLEAQ